MRVLVTGGTGFIGRPLCRSLIAAGHEITLISRREGESGPGVSRVVADPTRPGPWRDQVLTHDAVVNLAGASIAGRWSGRRKRILRDSRLKTTRLLVEAARSGGPVVMLSGSATGYYGDRDADLLDETAERGGGFLADLAADWEGAAAEAGERGTRVVLLRIGIVLGRGGVLGALGPVFRAGLGGPIGTGRQWMSWIHIEDLVRALILVLEDNRACGPFNLTAPNPVTNREFAKALGRAVGRPAVLRAPSFLLKAALGEASSLVLGSQRAVPEKLLGLGFEFRYPVLGAALRDVLAAEAGSAAG